MAALMAGIIIGNNGGVIGLRRQLAPALAAAWRRRNVAAASA